MKPILTTTAAATLLMLTSAISIAQQTTKASTPASPAAATAPAVMVTLATPQKQGPTGQAILAQHGNDVLVTLKMAASTQVADASIVHGACAQQTGGTQPSSMSTSSKNSKNSMSLSAVTNGISQTTVTGTTVQQLTTGGYAIIVHQNPSTLCGDLNTANPIPAQQQ